MTGQPDVVVIGGGSGAPILLLALKMLGIERITMCNPTSDSGGGGIVVANGFGIPASSDVERCVIALAPKDIQPEIELLFSVRFDTPGNNQFHGIRASNLVTAAYQQHFGDFQEAIDALCRLCRVTGRVAPLTKSRVDIRAYYTNGKVIDREHNIDDPEEAWQLTESIERLSLITPAVANPAAISAIANADVILLSFGSLYTSLIAGLVVPGAVGAIRQARANGARIVYFSNTMTEPGQTSTLTKASQHADVVMSYLNRPEDTDQILTHVVVDSIDSIPSDLEGRYSQSGARIVVDDLGQSYCGIQVVHADLLARETYTATTTGKRQVIQYVRHDTTKLAPIIQSIVWPVGSP